jgi:hypothetical protein
MWDLVLKDLLQETRWCNRNLHHVRWNLIYADAYAEMLWEKNTILWLKSGAEYAYANRVLIWTFDLTVMTFLKCRCLHKHILSLPFLTCMWRTAFNKTTVWNFFFGRWCSHERDTLSIRAFFFTDRKGQSARLRFQFTGPVCR